MDTDKTHCEKTRRELQKNVTSYLERIMESTLHETTVVRQLTSHLNNHLRRKRHAGHYWRSNGKLIRDVLLWTPTQRLASGGRPTKTYLHQLCADAECSLEDLPGAVNDKDRLGERESGKSVLSVRLDEDDPSQLLIFIVKQIKSLLVDLIKCMTG